MLPKSESLGYRASSLQVHDQLSEQASGLRQVKFQIKSKILLLDYDGNLPANVNISDGKTADNKGAYDIPLLACSVIVADRLYNDFSLLNVWDSSGVWFVVRHKENL